MDSITKDFLKDEKNIVEKNEVAIIRKHVLCNDGFVFSVQASRFHYCLPRENLNDGEYTHVEVSKSWMGNECEGFTSYLDDFTNYGYRYGDVIGLVPIERVDEVINLHGGIYVQ